MPTPMSAKCHKRTSAAGAALSFWLGQSLSAPVALMFIRLRRWRRSRPVDVPSRRGNLPSPMGFSGVTFKPLAFQNF